MPSGHYEMYAVSTEEYAQMCMLKEYAVRVRAYMRRHPEQFSKGEKKRVTMKITLINKLLHLCDVNHMQVAANLKNKVKEVTWNDE